jgi:hypothetical protein
VSPELRLLVSPRAAYAALVHEGATVSLVGAMRRPWLAAVVIGASVSMSATGRGTPALVLGTTIAWSYIVILQLAIALALIAPRARRTVGIARAIDLFFAGHAPWSLVALAAAIWSPSPYGRPSWPLDALAIVAVLLTPRIIAAFFGEVLGLDPRAARRMTVVHQAVTWTVFLVVFWNVNALSPRALELLGRS